jgi:hypothetical protein
MGLTAQILVLVCVSSLMTVLVAAGALLAINRLGASSEPSSPAS